MESDDHHDASDAADVARGRAAASFRDPSKITLAVASTGHHIEQILALQRRYHYSALSAAQQQAEGFVFAEHSVALLERMASELPQAIALAEDRVVGYCLAMPASMRDALPSLAPMFDHFDRCRYRGRPLAGQRYVVGGQVCVDRPFRGRGLLGRLYHTLAARLAARFDCCVTEIAERNAVSLRAHARMGFDSIARYADAREAWVIVAWDFALRRPQQ